MKHTPGPWKVSTTSETTVRSPAGENIAVSWQKVPSNKRLPSRDEAIANARLIAAAPEMLALLLECEVLVGEFPVIKQRISALINKVTEP